MTFPFFSILLPTKNRAALVPTAIQSVLRQTFPDFELIVADNDDTEATARTLGAFHDPRLIHLRTGKLSMADNWEMAAARARGRYSCFLEDKQAYKRDTLERLYTMLEEERVHSVRWQSDALCSYGNLHRLRHARTGPSPRRVTAEEVLRCFTGASYSRAKRYLPLGHFSAVHCDLVQRIRDGAAGRLCLPMSPDYTMAFSQLAVTDTVLVLSDALVVFATVTLSNGMNIRRKSGGVAALARELGREQEGFYDCVPIKTLTVANTIFNDYLHLRKLWGGRLAEHPLDWPNYFRECMESIGESAQLGLNVDDELTQWENAFSQADPSVRRALESELGSTMKARRARLLARFRPRSPLSDAIRQMKYRIRKSLLRDPDWQFESVDAYLEKEYNDRVGPPPQRKSAVAE
ncbi:MAG: glycosyltransferase family 2 protein [Kiritimatiellaeota bacterium]|nr:glycosyltransferase family 2 protein [Kiritimatiellota bacterium]